jgi:hypothetical protein
MGLSNWTPKVTAFAVLGSVATVLFMIGVSEFWKHDFRRQFGTRPLVPCLPSYFFELGKLHL